MLLVLRTVSLLNSAIPLLPRVKESSVQPPREGDATGKESFTLR